MSGSTRIAHITDAHTTVTGRPTTVLKHRSLGILEDFIGQINDCNPDCVLFGGDNIDNRGDGAGDAEAFARLTADLPDWRFVPGNHEASGPKPGRITKAQFQHRFAAHGVGPSEPGFSHRAGDVRIIGLDTTMVGAPGGLVPPDGLAYLASEMAASTEAHIVVLGHHLLVPTWAAYPFPKWAEDYLVRNAQDVIDILGRHPRVRAYLCGHHHAHRIDWVAAARGGFHQIMTSSPVAFPHAVRMLTFTEESFEVATLRPQDDTVVEEGRQAVLLGRKAQRFAELGQADAFLPYLEGDAEDGEVVLYYGEPRVQALGAQRSVSRSKSALAARYSAHRR